MIVINSSLKTIVAFPWKSHGGPGEDTLIDVGNQAEINPEGIILADRVICSDNPAEKDGVYQLLEDQPVCICSSDNPNAGITVRYFNPDE